MSPLGPEADWQLLELAEAIADVSPSPEERL